MRYAETLAVENALSAGPGEVLELTFRAPDGLQLPREHKTRAGFHEYRDFVSDCLDRFGEGDVSLGLATPVSAPDLCARIVSLLCSLPGVEDTHGDVFTVVYTAPARSGCPRAAMEVDVDERGMHVRGLAVLVSAAAQPESLELLPPVDPDDLLAEMSA